MTKSSGSERIGAVDVGEVSRGVMGKMELAVEEKEGVRREAGMRWCAEMKMTWWSKASVWATMDVRVL
jgi:hypothetical protein